MVVLPQACSFSVEYNRLDSGAPDRLRVEPWPISGREMNGAARERQRRIEQSIVRLEETIELAGIADGRAGDRGLEPAMDLAAKAIAQHRLHAAGAHAFQSLMQAIETAETLELQLAESDSFDGGGALDVGKRADRLIEHQGHGGGSGHGGIGFPIIGIAGLLE